MTRRRLLLAALTTLFITVFTGAVPADGKKAPARDVNRLTGILKSVDVKRGTLTLDDVGVNVDEALSRILKERGKDAGAGGPAKPRAAEDGKTRVVAINAKTKIFIRFRSSPSVANNVEHELKDLQRMTGYPVTVEIGAKGEGGIASEVIAWRGTPWK